MELNEDNDASLQRARNAPLAPDSDGPAVLLPADYEQEKRQKETQLSLALQPEAHTQIRLQLRQCFFDIHFGGDASPPPMFVHIVSETGIQIKALEAGMDALCVAQLATTMRDERLGRTSSLLYSIAIRQLSHELQRFVSNDMSGSTLAQIIKAIDVLISCSWFKCIAAGPGDWNRHMTGMLDIIERFGVNVVPLEMRGPLYNGWQHNAMLLGLHYRRVMVHRLTAPPPIDEDAIPRFAAATGASAVPSLLLQAHKLTHNGGHPLAEESIMAMLVNLGNKVAALKRWQLREASFLPPHHRVVPISDPSFSRFVNISGVCTPPFALAYTFDSTTHAAPFRISMVCVMKCQQAMLVLHRQLQRSVHKNSSNIEQQSLKVHMEVLQREAMTTAESLCMLVPWSTQPRDMNVACVDAFRLLYEATKHYESEPDSPERHLHWCRTFRRALIHENGTEVRFES